MDAADISPLIAYRASQRLGLRPILAAFDAIAAPLLIILVAGLTDHAHNAIDDFEKYLDLFFLVPFSQIMDTLKNLDESCRAAGPTNSTTFYSNDYDHIYPTMEEKMSEQSISGRTALLCSVDAFLAGLVFSLAILLALFERPSDVVGVLTDIKVHLRWDNRILGMSGAVMMLVVAGWRSWRIYQSKVITGSMQFGIGLLGCALVTFKFYLFLIGLRKAIIGGILSM